MSETTLPARNLHNYMGLLRSCYLRTKPTTITLLDQRNFWLHSRAYPYTYRWVQLSLLLKSFSLQHTETVTDNYNWSWCRDRWIQSNCHISGSGDVGAEWGKNISRAKRLESLLWGGRVATSMIPQQHSCLNKTSTMIISLYRLMWKGGRVSTIDKELKAIMSAKRWMSPLIGYPIQCGQPWNKW